jgi:hypothetical protein
MKPVPDFAVHTSYIRIRPGCVGQTQQYRADTVPLTPAGELRLSASSNPDPRQNNPTIPDSIPTSADHDIRIHLGHHSINPTRQSSPARTRCGGIAPTCTYPQQLPRPFRILTECACNQLHILPTVLCTPPLQETTIPRPIEWFRDIRAPGGEPAPDLRDRWL